LANLTSSFPLLEKGLSSNQELKAQVLTTQKVGYLKYLDQLFVDLFDGPCKGIEIKVNEIGDLSRFGSLISELEFARYFVENGNTVQLLANDIFQGRRAPDMLVLSKDKEYFVEVKNIEFDDEDYDFGNEIAAVLNNAGKTFMVVIKSGSLLATPAYKYQSRDQKEMQCKTALDEFKEQLNNLPPPAPEINVHTSIADIELHPTKLGKSYLGIGTMLQAISEPPEYRERIRYDILQKSRKRDDWFGDELSKCYIVAVDDNSMFFYIDRYNVELFGNCTFYSSPLPVPEIPITKLIDYSLKQGWKDYLTRMCVLRNNRSVILENQRGMLFTESSMTNVTAILVKHSKSFYLLANPFADEKINNANILNELRGCIIGWE